MIFKFMNLKIYLPISLFLEWTSRVTLQLETITLPLNYLPSSDGSYEKPFFGNLSLTEVKLTKSRVQHCIILNT